VLAAYLELAAHLTVMLGTIMFILPILIPSNLAYFIAILGGAAANVLALARTHGVHSLLAARVNVMRQSLTSGVDCVL